MSGFVITVGAFIVVIGPLIILHELGHFMVAKFFGIRVDVFSVGFGKRLWGFKKGATDYRISLIPLGGYVKMAGESLDDQVTGAPDEFISKPKWQRLCVAFAGPVMNLITAVAIVLAICVVRFPFPSYFPEPTVIGYVDPNSAAANAGIKAGDTIVKLDGINHPLWFETDLRVSLYPDLPMSAEVDRGGQILQVELRPSPDTVDRYSFGRAGFYPVLGPGAKLLALTVLTGSPADRAGLKANDQILAVNGLPLAQNWAGNGELIVAIHSSSGKPVTLSVLRDGKDLSITATPESRDGAYRIGFQPGAFDDHVVKMSFFSALKFSVLFNLENLQLLRVAIAQVIARKRSASTTVSGPIAIAQASGEVAREGVGPLLTLMSQISLTLGILNLLPIPVLDGGLIFMLLLESGFGLLGFTLSLKVKERMLQIGFVVLMAIMAFAIVNDIRHIMPPSAPLSRQQPARK